MTNAIVIECYQVGRGIARDYYNFIETSNVKQWSDIPPPARVRLNGHNINDVHKALFEVDNVNNLLFYLNVFLAKSYCNLAVTFAQTLCFIYWRSK